MAKKLIQTLTSDEASIVDIYLVGGEYQLILPGGRRIGRVDNLAMAEAAAVAYYQAPAAGCPCC